MTDYTNNYKNLLIKQYWNKTNATAEIELKSATFERIYNLLRSFETEFDLDLADGDRLDKIGKIVGISREDLEPYFDLFFGFDDNQFSLPFGDKGYWSLSGYTYNSISNNDYFDISKSASNLILTVASVGDNNIWYSTDGASISQSAGLTDWQPYRSIHVESLGIDVVCGHDTSDGSYNIATSADGGVNWTKRDAAGLTSSKYLDICFCSHNNTILTAQSKAPTVRMLRSTDGINWSSTVIPYQPGTIYCCDYSPTLKKALFLAGSGTTGGWVLSGDGQNFDTGPISGDFRDVKWVNHIDKFVAVGAGSATIKTFDGYVWSDVTPSPAIDIDLRSVTVTPDNKIIVSGIDDGAGYVALESIDGITWSQSSISPSGDIYSSYLDADSGKNYFVTRSDSYIASANYILTGVNLDGKFYDRFYTNTIPGVLTDDEYRYYIKAKISINSASGYMVSDEYISIQQIIQYLFDGYAIVFDNQRMQLTLEVEDSVEKGRVLLARNLNLLPRPQGVEYNSVNLAGYDYFGFDDDPNALGFGDGSDISIGGIFAEAIA